MLSNKFYANLYNLEPGTMRRDTSGLSAVCLLPPQTKIELPPASAGEAFTGMRREIADGGYPYPRSFGRNRPQSAMPLPPKPGAPNKKTRPQTASASRKNTAAAYVTSDIANKALERSKRPQSASVSRPPTNSDQNKPGSQQNKAKSSKMRPQSAHAGGSRAATADSQDSHDRRVDFYRKQPVSKSRKCWNRINPGHMLEKWDSTHRTIGNPEYKKDNYLMVKEAHLAKTDIATYVHEMIMMGVSIKTGFR